MTTLALKVAEFHTDVHLLFELDAERVLTVMESIDSFRRPERFQQYLLAGEADFRGRPGYEDAPMPEGPAFQACFDAAAAVTATEFVEAGLSGLAIAQAIRNKRLKVIGQTLQQHRPSR
jgi:tRNA nucleotidyltransferase (CCA-adding enzyme)